VASDYIIEHDLERPGTGQTHGRFDQHREKYDSEGPTVGGDEIANESKHSALRMMDSGGLFRTQKIGLED